MTFQVKALIKVWQIKCLEVAWLKHQQSGSRCSGEAHVFSPTSAKRFFSQIKSVNATANAKTTYSASVDNKATLVCLLVAHNIAFLKSFIRNPEVDFLSSSFP